MALNQTLDHHLSQFIESYPSLCDLDSYAVAVSGGPDSLALAHLLSEFVSRTRKKLHVLTVDHGLRSDSQEEAEKVGAWVKSLGKPPQITHQILTWEGEKPEQSLMEEARHARYKLMTEYCASHHLSALFIAHHLDDQAETFLFRLSKGSGLDGLAAMGEKHLYNKHLTLWRPLLSVPKQDLQSYCEAQNLLFVEDPSNMKEAYMRPRLRRAREVLEQEGLTSKRLALTAERLRRARVALEILSDEAYQKAVKKEEKKEICLDWTFLKSCPEEISLRVLSQALNHLREEEGYGVRMEKIESLFFALWTEKELSLFKRRTLGGCLFSFDSRASILVLKKEEIKV